MALTCPKFWEMLWVDRLQRLLHNFLSVELVEALSCIDHPHACMSK